MLCESTVVTMLERDREPLGVGRKRRLATRPQRRAMLRRDRGCARPGCTETRIERLHAHHMRWWTFGGGTNVDDMVLLCDVDHGLVHDLDLVMTRRAGQLIVLTQDGRRIWGGADAAFTGGVPGVETEPFVDVHPIGVTAGRRPALTVATVAATATATATEESNGDPVTRLLFPDGVPPLPDAMRANGERMQMAYVVGVLMGNRDLQRRLAAEAKGDFSLAA
jgi:hypothetical protein